MSTSTCSVTTSRAWAFLSQYFTRFFGEYYTRRCTASNEASCFLCACELFLHVGFLGTRLYIQVLVGRMLYTIREWGRPGIASDIGLGMQHTTIYWCQYHDWRPVWGEAVWQGPMTGWLLCLLENHTENCWSMLIMLFGVYSGLIYLALHFRGLCLIDPSPHWSRIV